MVSLQHDFSKFGVSCAVSSALGIMVSGMRDNEILACRDRMDSLERAHVNTWYHALSALIKSPWSYENTDKGHKSVSFYCLTNYPKLSGLNKPPFIYVMILQVTQLGTTSGFGWPHLH